MPKDFIEFLRISTKLVVYFENLSIVRAILDSTIGNIEIVDELNGTN